MSNRFTVIVPAYNEETVIGRLLRAIAPPPDQITQMDVIVALNGCSDNSASVAREAMPMAQIVEIPRAGKANAINHGLVSTKAFPVFVVDADVITSFAALAATARSLGDKKAMIAAPALTVDCERSSAAVRAYYRVWQSLPYVRDGLIGSGIYGLSEVAADRIGMLPEVIADDQFVRLQFAPEERLSVQADGNGNSVSFIVTAPRNLLPLLRIEARRRAGDAELAQLPQMRKQPRDTTLGSLLRYGCRPAQWADLAIYLGIKIGGRVLYLFNRLRGRSKTWWRDDSSR